MTFTFNELEEPPLIGDCGVEVPVVLLDTVRWAGMACWLGIF